MDRPTMPHTRLCVSLLLLLLLLFFFFFVVVVVLGVVVLLLWGEVVVVRDFVRLQQQLGSGPDRHLI